MTVHLPLTLDLLWPNNEVIFSKTGDTDRHAEISLLEGIDEWEIPAGASCTLYAKQINQTVKTSSTFTIEDNKLKVLLPTFTVPGRAKTDVEISVGGEVVTTFDFTIVVLQSA